MRARPGRGAPEQLESVLAFLLGAVHRRVSGLEQADHVAGRIREDGDADAGGAAEGVWAEARRPPRFVDVALAEAGWQRQHLALPLFTLPALARLVRDRLAGDPVCSAEAPGWLAAIGREQTLMVMVRHFREQFPKALELNSDQLKISLFEEGIGQHNVDAFLDGVDLYVDGLDFFAFSARKAVFDACARRRVPATTVAPLGMGAALLNFLPGQMTFEEYFRWDGCSEEEMALRFFVGLAPARLQQGYLVDPSSIDFKSRKGPSTAMGCQLFAGVAATEALKILLGRGDVVAAPRGVHFDAFRNKAVTTWRPGGNGNPLQRLALSVGRRKLGIGRT